MTVLETVIALAQITPEHVAQAAVMLNPVAPGEEVLGVIESWQARALWALAHRYEREAAMYAHSAMFDSASREERQTFTALAEKTSAYEEVARDLAWVEIREQLPDLRAWRDMDVGLRTDYTLVKSVHKGGPSVFGLEIPMDGIIEVIRRHRERQAAAAPDPVPPKGKPQ